MTRAINMSATAAIAAGIALLLSTHYAAVALLIITSGCLAIFGVSFREAYTARRAVKSHHDHHREENQR